MASKLVRRQMLIIGIAEGFVEMMWDQHYRDHPRNKTFAAMRRRLKATCIDGIALLKKEAHGGLTERDLSRIKKNIDLLHRHIFQKGQFVPMQAVSFAIGLIGDQLVLVQQGTPKHKMFDNLWYRILEFDRFFNRKKEYDAPDGYDALCYFETLDI